MSSDLSGRAARIGGFWMAEFAPEIAALEQQLAAKEQRESSILIRCHDCGGSQIYKCTDEGYLVYHSCKDGKQVREMLAAKDAEIARLRSAANVEVGWLVEDEYGRLCIGLECGNKISWVTFTNPNAIRFARKRDAENAITLWKLNGNAREHSWG